MVLLDIAELAQAPIAGNRAQLDGDRVGYYLTLLDQAPPVVVFDAVSLGVGQRGLTADEVREAIRRRGDTTTS